MQKDSQIKVSVIIPVYNGMPFLENCVNSVIGQTYKNIEIIVIDDGSTDGSGMLCDKFQQADERIKVIHKENEGLVKARKIGIERAVGDYFVFVDADDEIDAQEVEILCSKAKETSADIILFGLVEEQESGSVDRINKCREGIYLEDDIRRDIIANMIHTGSFFSFGILPNFVCKFVKKSFFDRASIEISEDVTFGEDADFSYQMIPQAKSLYVMNTCLYHYKKRSGSMVWKGVSREMLKHLEDNLKVCFRKLGIYDLMKRQLSDYILYAKLLKMPFEIIDFDQFRGKRVALYGAGGFGQAIYAFLSDSILVWVDRDCRKYNVEGLKVEAVPMLVYKEDLYDIIFIAVLNIEVCEEIAGQLREMGIEKQTYYFRLERV